MKLVGRLLKSAGLGVWHFLVGDSPEFLPAVVALVGFALLLHGVHQAVWFGLPVLVLGALVVSLWRRQRAQRSPNPQRR